jgi:hypothetical protein
MARRFPRVAILVLRRKVRMSAPKLAKRIAGRSFASSEHNALAQHAGKLGYQRILGIIRDLDARFPARTA